MRLDYVSDLHLEFSEFPITKNDLNPSKDAILLCAGDTFVTAYMPENRTDAKSRSMQRRFRRFVEETSDYKEVICIPGNHEAYAGGDVALNCERANEFFARIGATNFRMVDRERIPLTDDFDLLAATLWTDMNKGNPITLNYVGGGMNDFHVSLYKEGRFFPDHAMEMFLITRQWLGDQLLDTSKDFIVMTHHLPTYEGIDPRFKGDELNHGYASDLHTFIEQHPNISVWIHGHTHYDTDFMIGETRVLSHQRGYPPEFSFDRSSNWVGYKCHSVII